ncbi:hypothetical protein C8R46DRAFT_1080756 [Mycena filopes]|nr:hypothetical protein C8R46DRAFT_1080756 [Mycena filopes]
MRSPDSSSPPPPPTSPPVSVQDLQTTAASVPKPPQVDKPLLRGIAPHLFGVVVAKPRGADKENKVKNALRVMKERRRAEEAVEAQRQRLTEELTALRSENRQLRLDKDQLKTQLHESKLALAVANHRFQFEKRDFERRLRMSAAILARAEKSIGDLTEAVAKQFKFSRMTG